MPKRKEKKQVVCRGGKKNGGGDGGEKFKAFNTKGRKVGRGIMRNGSSGVSK